MNPDDHTGGQTPRGPEPNQPAQFGQAFQFGAGQPEPEPEEPAETSWLLEEEGDYGAAEVAPGGEAVFALPQEIPHAPAHDVGPQLGPAVEIALSGTSYVEPTSAGHAVKRALGPAALCAALGFGGIGAWTLMKRGQDAPAVDLTGELDLAGPAIADAEPTVALVTPEGGNPTETGRMSFQRNGAVIPADSRGLKDVSPTVEEPREPGELPSSEPVQVKLSDTEERPSFDAFDEQENKRRPREVVEAESEDSVQLNEPVVAETVEPAEPLERVEAIVLPERRDEVAEPTFGQETLPDSGPESSSELLGESEQSSPQVTGGALEEGQASSADEFDRAFAEALAGGTQPVDPEALALLDALEMEGLAGDFVSFGAAGGQADSVPVAPLPLQVFGELFAEFVPGPGFGPESPEPQESPSEGDEPSSDWSRESAGGRELDPGDGLAAMDSRPVFETAEIQLGQVTDDAPAAQGADAPEAEAGSEPIVDAIVLGFADDAETPAMEPDDSTVLEIKLDSLLDTGSPQDEFVSDAGSQSPELDGPGVTVPKIELPFESDAFDEAFASAMERSSEESTTDELVQGASPEQTAEAEPVFGGSFFHLPGLDFSNPAAADGAGGIEDAEVVQFIDLPLVADAGEPTGPLVIELPDFGQQSGGGQPNAETTQGMPFELDGPGMDLVHDSDGMVEEITLPILTESTEDVDGAPTAEELAEANSLLDGLFGPDAEDPFAEALAAADAEPETPDISDVFPAPAPMGQESTDRRFELAFGDLAGEDAVAVPLMKESEGYTLSPEELAGLLELIGPAGVKPDGGDSVEPIVEEPAAPAQPLVALPDLGQPEVAQPDVARVNPEVAPAAPVFQAEDVVAAQRTSGEPVMVEVMPGLGGSGAKSKYRGVVRRVNVESIWESTSVPKDQAQKSEFMLTPRVGQVRVTFNSGETVDGRLHGIGQNRIVLDSKIGRMTVDARRTQGIHKLGGGGQRSNGQISTEGLQVVRVRAEGGVIQGHLLAREGNRVTLLLERGMRVTLESDEIEPAAGGGGNVSRLKRQ